MAMDLRDYFHRRCSEALVMERDIWQLSSLMGQECWHAELKRFFERHNDPKRQQISNLEQIVDELGGILGPLDHPVTQAIRRLHRQFLETNPPQALIEVNNALEADKAIHLELAIFAGLIELADELGEEGFTRLLAQDRQIEEEMRAALAAVLPGVLHDFGDQLRHAA